MSRRTPKIPPAAVAAPAKRPAEAVAAAAAAPAAPSPVEMIAPVVTGTSTAGIEAVRIAEHAADTVSVDLSPVADAAATATFETQTKAAESVISAAEEAASTVQKDMIQMATQFETPQTLNDMTAQTQSAVEKGQKFVAEFGDFGKGNVEAMVEAGKIAAKGFETLGQDNAEFTRRSFEGMTSTAKSLASVKSPTEFFKLQSDYMRSAFDGVVAQTSKNTEAFIKLASDAAQPLSNRFAVAVEKVKTAA